MNPILYPEDTYLENVTGIGYGPISCSYAKVTEELNGKYELELQVFKGSQNYENLKPGNIVACYPNIHDEMQSFRIYDVREEISRTVTVYARHISYDLGGFPVPNRTFSTVSAALNFNSYRIQPIEMDAYTWTVDSGLNNNRVAIESPCSIRSVMYGPVLEQTAGEWRYDNHKCQLLVNRGNGSEDEPVTNVYYGKNVTSLDIGVDNEGKYTHVVSYWQSEDNGVKQTVVGNAMSVFIPPKYPARTYIQDMSSEYDYKPGQIEMDQCSVAFMTENPSIKFDHASIKVDWFYNDEPVGLGDYVRVWIDEDNFYTSRIISTEFDAIGERYTSVVIGDKQMDIVDSITEVVHENTVNTVPGYEDKTVKSGFYAQRYGHSVSLDFYGAKRSNISGTTLDTSYRPNHDISRPVIWIYNNNRYDGYLIIRTTGAIECYFYTPNGSTGTWGDSGNSQCYGSASYLNGFNLLVS